MTKIHRSPYYYGTERDFQMAIQGMKPIANIRGVNDGVWRYWIHPITCKIVHLLNCEQKPRFEPVYTWMETTYDPTSQTGFSSGRKVVRIGEKTFYLSRLIASTFVDNDNPREKTIVFHKNRDQRDCQASNLEWISRTELSSYRKRPQRLKLYLKPQKPSNNGSD